MNLTKIGYWASTILLSLLLVASSIGDLLLAEEIVAGMQKLGIPLYLMPFFGVMKILGTIAIWVPQLARLREGAYAGIIFYAIGAIYVHIAGGDPVSQAGGGVIMLVLALTSYLTSLRVRGK